MSAQPRDVVVKLAPERAFRRVKLDECAERGPVWLVQGLIEQGAVTAVTGEPGSAKSFLLVDMALHVAANRDWFGRKVERGAVLYIASEAAESVQRRAALARRVKFGNETLPVEIVTEPVLLGDEIHSATDREALERLIDSVAADYHLPVALVILDTIAASMGTGNENLDGMQRLVGAANMLAARTGVAVILNHHPNAGGGTLRGHSSLRGTVSHGFQIEVKGDVRIFTAFKQRDAESGRLFAYRLGVYDLEKPDNFGDRATSCVIEAAEIPADDGKTDDHDNTKLLLAVQAIFTEKASAGGLLRFGEIFDHCTAACDFLVDKSADASRKALGRALKTLSEAGVIERCELPRGHYRMLQGARK